MHRGEWERVRLQSSARVPEFAGKNFLEISELMGQDPWDCYFDIMAAAGRGLNSLIMIGRLFTERHMAEMITHPLFNLAVDIWSTRIDGPLSDQTRHPLYFSGHISYLTHYVRELGLLRLEDVIRKMTSMPATHFGLRNRGLVRAGCFADVVVFDYQSLSGVSTLIGRWPTPAASSMCWSTAPQLSKVASTPAPALAGIPARELADYLTVITPLILPARSTVHIAVVGVLAGGVERPLELVRPAEQAAVEGAIVGGDGVRVCAAARPDQGRAHRHPDRLGRKCIVRDLDLSRSGRRLTCHGRRDGRR